MFLQRLSEYRAIFHRVPASSIVRNNCGAIYIATSRMMSSEIGSGAGKGGGSGGRLV